MDFYKVADCLIANCSISEYFRTLRSTVDQYYFALVFLKDFPRLPDVGLSLLSAEDLFFYQVSPTDTVAYCEWKDLMPGWERLIVKKYNFMIVRIIVEERGICMQFQLGPIFSTSPCRCYDYPCGYRDAYLAVNGKGVFGSLQSCSIALLDAKRFEEFKRVIFSVPIRSIPLNKTSRIHNGCARRDLLAKNSSNFSEDRSFFGVDKQLGTSSLLNNRCHRAGAFSKHSVANHFDSAIEGWGDQRYPPSKASTVPPLQRDKTIIEKGRADFQPKSLSQYGKSEPKEAILKHVEKREEREYTDDESSEEDDDDSSSLSSQGKQDSTKDMDEDLILCECCQEKRIEVVFLPCGHASICFTCYCKYINQASSKVTGDSTDTKESVNTKLACCLCREPVEGFGRVWIHSTKCLICGCNKLNAIAGGKDGCGCLIGCYDKAVQMLKDGEKCPHCSKKLIKIVKTYICN